MSRTRNAAALLLCCATAARAQSVSGSGVTLFDSHPVVRDGVARDESPMLELVSLSANAGDAGPVEGLHIIARGWGKVIFGDPLDGTRGTGDLDAFYVEGGLFKQRLGFRLGRQLVTSGVARAAQVDGLSVRGLVVNGLGVEAWAGAPVSPRFDVSKGDFLSGGRVFWRQGFDSEIGASFVYSLSKGYLARKDVGVDGTWNVSRKLTLGTAFTWSLEEERLAEGRLFASYQPVRAVQVTVDARRVSPDLFLDRDSIFAVFADEKHDEVGGDVVWRVTEIVSLSGDYHFRRYDDYSTDGTLPVQNGQNAGVKLSLRPGQLATYGVELRALDEPENGYRNARLFSIWRLHEYLRATLDLDGYWFDKDPTGSAKRSLVGTASLGWMMAAWDLSVAGSYGTTPLFDRRGQIIARATYRFGGAR